MRLWILLREISLGEAVLGLPLYIGGKKYLKVELN